MADVHQTLRMDDPEDVCMPPLVRMLDRKDLKQYVELLNQLSTVGDVSQKQLAQFYNEVSRSMTHQVVVVEYEGRLAGCATLLVEQKLLHGFKRVGHIEDVVTDKAARGKGFGKLMVVYLSALSARLGCYKVILDCSEDNVTFYEKSGLKKHGVEMALYFE